jgi:general secretion pathway protein D
MLLRAAVLVVSILLTLLVAALEAQDPPQPPKPVPIGSLSLQNASLVEVVDQLAQRLGINYIPDARLKGSVSISTYGETRELDARNLLETVLRINGFGMVQEGPLYRIVPLAEAARHPIRTEINARDIADDDQLMLNLVFLKYMTVVELTEILKNFTGENAILFPYAPANLLFIQDSRRAMRRTMDLIALFDSDTFAGERVRLFELKNVRPSDIQKELESVLRAFTLDNKSLTVRFLPVDRISTLIAVAQNPGVFDKVEEWLKKLDIPVAVTAGGTTDTYVYRVRYGRADCLAMALTQLYMPLYGYGGMGYGGFGGVPLGAYAAPGLGYGAGAVPYGGGGSFGAFGGYGAGLFGNPYAGGFGGGYGAGGYGSANAFMPGFGGAGACGGFGAMGGLGGYGMGGGFGAFPGAYGYPAFGGYAAQVPQASLMGVTPAPGAAGAPATTGQPAVPTGPSGEPLPNPPRIVPNPLDNSLLIQADAAQYQGILKILTQLDVPPRQILLEAKIYQVDMSGAFASGVTANFQARTGTERRPLGDLAGGIVNFSAGALVGQSRELLAFLRLEENATKARIISEPSLIATDSIPATINVGTQVPVLTSQVASPVQVSGTNTINQQISGRNTGVTLNVNARVNPSGVVTLIVNQEISRPAGGGGGEGGLTPSFAQQVVQTQLTVQDGDTIAIGGIIAENANDTSAGIPGLHRIPIVGAAFGNRTYTRSRSEFIIFMTPHVIYDNNDLLEASDELVARLRKLRKYLRP